MILNRKAGRKGEREKGMKGKERETVFLNWREGGKEWAFLKR